MVAGKTLEEGSRAKGFINYGEPRKSLPEVKEFLKTGRRNWRASPKHLFWKMVGEPSQRRAYRKIWAACPETMGRLNGLAADCGFSGVLLKDRPIKLSVLSVRLFGQEFDRFQAAGLEIPPAVKGEFKELSAGGEVILNYILLEHGAVPALDFVLKADNDFTARGLLHLFQHEQEHLRIEGGEDMMKAPEWKVDMYAAQRHLGVRFGDETALTGYFSDGIVVNHIMRTGLRKGLNEVKHRARECSEGRFEEPDFSSTDIVSRLANFMTEQQMRTLRTRINQELRGLYMEASKNLEKHP